MFISHEKINDFIRKALIYKKTRRDVIDHVAESLIQTSLRGVDSHGIRLFPHYIQAIDSGRINTDPKYDFKKKSTTTGMFDADHTFGHAAGGEAMKHAIKIAKKHGTGCISVFNSTHFGAAAYFSFIAAKNDMIGLSFTHADSLMLSYNGKRSFLGTNPICFAAPCKDEEPFIVDMATSLVNWNKIVKHRDNQEEIPDDWGVDINGEKTTNPDDIAYLLPIGKYKGYGLSMMIEILCSTLSGMPHGRSINRMYADSIEQKRNLGHFFMAIDINCFQEIDVFKKRLKNMMDEIRAEPPVDLKKPVLVPGDPEKKTFEKRIKKGIPVDHVTIQEFKIIAEKINYNF